LLLRRDPPAAWLGTPEEIAAAAVYLSSNEAAYVTRQTIHVMAGMAMFEPVAVPVHPQRGCFPKPVEAYSQGWGSVITEPRPDGQRRPLQDFENPVYCGAEPAVVRRALSLGRQNQDDARLRWKFNGRMVRIVLGSVFNGTSTRLNR